MTVTYEIVKSSSERGSSDVNSLRQDAYSAYAHAFDRERNTDRFIWGSVALICSQIWPDSIYLLITARAHFQFLFHEARLVLGNSFVF